ncbi:MAG: hypothetical protein ABI867_18145 [Kofleriaceae bacterium]
MLGIVGIGAATYLALRAPGESTTEPKPPPVEALRLVTTVPVDRADGAFLDVATGALINSFDSTSWISIDYDKPNRPISKIRWGYQGVLVDGPEVVLKLDPAKPNISVALIDAGGRETVVHSAVQAAIALAPDRRSYAVSTPDGIELFETAAGKSRVLLKDSGPALSWSPSGRQLAWVSHGKLKIARVSDASVRALSLPFASENGQPSVALIDENHLLYCALDNQQISLRRRSTSPAGGIGELVRELDPNVADCLFTTAGNRIALTLFLGSRQTARLDRSTGTAVPLGLPLGITITSVATDGRLISGFTREAFDPITKQRTTFKICDQQPDPVFQGRAGFERWNWVPVKGHWSFRLFDVDCNLLDAWDVSAPPSLYFAPRCLRDECFITTLQDRTIQIWALKHGKPARQLAPITVDGSGPVSTTMIDLDPDGHRISVSTLGATPSFWIVPTSGDDPVKTITTSASSVLWIDASHLLLSPGVRFDNVTSFEPESIGLDGTRERLWSSPTRSFSGLVRAPDGVIYGDLQDSHSEVLIFERAP